MAGRSDDLFYDTSQMLERIRPKARYDIAAVTAAALFGLAIVIAAALLQPNGPPRYVFHSIGDAIAVGHTGTGAVAFCQIRLEIAQCTEQDSAFHASIRRFDGESN